MSSRIESSFSKLSVTPAQNSKIPPKKESIFATPQKTYESPTTQEINVENLLELKLKNPALELSADESIALLTHCMTLGNQEAQKASDNELIVVIGNTGSGKSAFVNYLYGCKMKRVKPQDLGITGLQKVIVVKGSSEGGPLDEIMPIGHTKKSMTFMPKIAQDQQGLSYCDCPGFLDNRGIEINIANAINIKNAFSRANSIKIIMLINYYSLGADRARGLSDMIKISCDLFGSKENLIKYKDSILLGVTQVPLAEAQDEDEDNNQESLDNLKDFIADTGLEDPFEKQTLPLLAQRLFIYDPLDNLSLKYKGALKRDEILDQIDSMKVINEPAKIFKTVLTVEDEKGLIKISDEIKDKIEHIFEQKNLTLQDFKKVANYLDSLYKLEVIDHTHVTKLVSSTRNTITNQFRKMMHEFERAYFDTSSSLFQQSNETLEKMKAGVQYFDAHLQNDINLNALEERYNLYKKKYEAKELVEQLLVKERDFRNYCQSTNFNQANELMSEMEQMEKKFNENYREVGVRYPIDIKDLKKVYASAKNKYEIERKEKLKKTEQIKELKLQAEQMKKDAQEAERKQKQEAEKLKKEKEEQEQLKQGLEKIIKIQELKTKQKQKLENERIEAENKKNEERERERIREEKEEKDRLRKEEAERIRIEEEEVERKRIEKEEKQLKIEKKTQPKNQQMQLREQICGPGPVQIYGWQLKTTNGWLGIVWKSVLEDRAVVSTLMGNIMITKDGAFPVVLTPAGPMPI
jgi:hypothetical protein